MIAPSTIEELSEHVGEVGASAWQPVTQEEVDRFADATGDHQWIHTDAVRAAQTPLGGTIAHGFYTLSLAPKMLAELISFDRFGFAMNYGLDACGSRARCPSATGCGCAPGSTPSSPAATARTSSRP